MIENYTAAANEFIEDLAEKEAAKIWADIDELGTKSTPEKWKAKLNSIAQEYLMSSRFALMRILHNRVLSNAKEASSKASAQNAIFADENMFRVEVDSQWVTFSDISMAHCLSLSVHEHQAYLRYLLEIAGPSPEEDPDLHERVISRAWNDEEAANTLMEELLVGNISPDSPQYSKIVDSIRKSNARRFATAFSRSEAMELGHILKFTLNEMQWFLLRVFDTEGGSFRMNRAEDVIDAYGFLTEADCRHVASIKQKYQAECGNIQKIDDETRSQNWTQRISGGLIELIESWKRYPASMDENFFCWLSQHASGLDVPSRTARRIYRNLAVYAYQCACQATLAPEESDLYDELSQLFNQWKEDNTDCIELYEGEKLSSKKCTGIAKLLYRENKERSESGAKDSTQSWSVISTRKDGALSSSYGAVNSSRTRIQLLLMGDEEVEKGDLLYLLWFTMNLTWFDHPTDDPDTLCCRVLDLKDLADALLQAVLLPPFYPPHLMEQSMLLSIIHSGKIDKDPAVVYSSVLAYIKESRARQGGSGKHTLQEKIAIVNQHRSGMTLKQCALVNSISEKTLSQWQKELIVQGHIV